MLALALVIAAVLAVVQSASMSVYGDLAARPSVPALIPASYGIALAAAALRIPSAHVRTAAARALLHRDDPRAAAAIALLPATRAAADLRGQLALARGDTVGAFAAFVAAGDFERAQAHVDALASGSGPGAAISAQQQLVAALHGAGQATIEAIALWRLGQLEHEQAVVTPSDAAALDRASLAAFMRALALAPNDETYLLAAGTQALTIGDRAAAARYYRRALDAVPDSVDARIGLARATR